MYLSSFDWSKKEVNFMSLFLILWFADLCDSMVMALILLIIVGAGALIVTMMLTPEDPDEPMEETHRKVFAKYFKIYGILILIVGAITFILPSSKTIYIATGINAVAEATKTVAESDTAKKAIELLNIKLDDYLSEAKKDK